MQILLRIAFVLIILTLSIDNVPLHAADDPSVDFLDDDINLEDIFADMPSSFDLMKADIGDIVDLHVFSETDARRLIAVRDSLAKRSEQAKLADSLDLSPLQRMVVDTIVSEPVTVSTPIVTTLRSGYLTRSDYNDASEGKYYLKAISHLGDTIGLSILGERDAREPKAIDFYSGAITFRSKCRGITAIIGDYAPGYGQGLLFSRYGRNFSGGTNIVRKDTLSPQLTFFDETRYLRGFFCRFDRGAVTADASLSTRNLDASLEDDGDVLTIRKDGYHYQGDPYGNLNEKLAAARITGKINENLKLGITGSTVTYSPRLSKDNDERRFYSPSGSHFSYLSFDGNLRFGETILFFERAAMNGDNTAVIGGVKTKKSHVSATFAVRRYDRDFYSLRSSPLSAFGGCSNEEGVYGSFEILLHRSLRINASMDIADTSGRTYFAAMPESKRRFSVKVSGKCLSRTEASLLCRVADDSDGFGRKSARFGLEGSTEFWIVNAWETCLALSGSGDSSGPFAETGVKCKYNEMTANIEANWFDIPSYDARFYHTATSIPGKWNLDAYWGKGWSGVVVVRYKPISLRYRFLNAKGKTSIRELSVQTDIAF